MIETLSHSRAVYLLLSDEFANWSRDGAEMLVDWYEEMEEDTGEPIEFDRVAMRCEWSEYPTIEEASIDFDTPVSEMLEDTTVLQSKSCVLVMNY